VIDVCFARTRAVTMFPAQCDERYLIAVLAFRKLPLPLAQDFSLSAGLGPNNDSALFNAMIYPLRFTELSGVFWHDCRSV